MLISFSASNFKSLKEETHFSMLPKKAFKELPQNLLSLNKKPKLLSSAIIYGANASGKSNLYDAMNFVSNLLYSKPDDQKVGVYFNAFSLDEKMDGQAIKLNYQFIGSENIEFSYALEFTNHQIVYEGLHFKPKGQEALLYERRGNEIHFGEYFKNQDVIRNYVNRPENQERLILIIAGQLGLEHVQTAFHFFSNQLLFWNQTSWDIGNEKNEATLLSHLYRNKFTVWFDYYKKLIMSLDIGLKNIDVEEFKIDNTDKIQHFLSTFRNRKKLDGSSELIPFGSYNESVGTHNILSLGIPIIDGLIYGKTIVIDEIDRSLHTQIVEYFIGLFNDPTVNTKNAQLICTSHNTLLMNSDLVRRDQIWIMEKDESGASQLFSLGDVGGLKKEMPIGKYYLAGKLGGTPIIDDLDFKKAFYGSQLQ